MTRSRKELSPSRINILKECYLRRKVRPTAITLKQAGSLANVPVSVVLKQFSIFRCEEFLESISIPISDSN